MTFPIQLNLNENNLHVIWIGQLPLNELDNFKIWAKWNPDFKINIWVDSDHILVPLLRQLIINFTKDNIDEQDEENPLSAVFLQIKFYNEFNLQKPEKSFHNFTKTFIIQHGWKSESEINQWIKNANDNLEMQKNEIQTLTNKTVFIHDIALEHNYIFDDQEYYNIYLRELEEAHFVAGASDLLRYQILLTEGGIYLDTDILPLLDIKKITEYIDNSIVNEFFSTDISYISKELIINELMKLVVLKKVNDSNLQILKNKIDNKRILTSDINVWKKISFEIINLNWSKYVIVPKKSPNSVDCVISRGLNCFIISKKKSSILKFVINQIKFSYKTRWLKDENTILEYLFKKIINDINHVFHTTGPEVFPDDDDYEQYKKCYMRSLFSLQSLNQESNWMNKSDIKLVDNFVDFKKTMDLYYFQYLLYEIQPNIEKIKHYQKLNEVLLSEWKTKLNNLLKRLDEFQEEMLSFDKIKYQQFFSLENNIKVTTKSINNVKIKIAWLIKLQKLASTKITFANFDSVVYDVNKNFDRPSNSKYSTNDNQSSGSKSQKTSNKYFKKCSIQ